MKFSEKLHISSRKKSSGSNIADEDKNRDFTEKENVASNAFGAQDTGERLYPSLGENYSKPGIAIILRLSLSVILLVLSIVLELADSTSMWIKAVAALIAGYDLIIFSFNDIVKGIYLRENLLVVVAAIISFVIGREVEAVIAPILLQVSYIARDYVLYRTRRTICEVIEPDDTILQAMPIENDAPDGKADLSKGDTIIIDAGMFVPADCVITEGSGKADFTFITGENTPKSLTKGDFLPAGSKCTDGNFTAEVCNAPESSLYKQISSVLKSGYGQMTAAEKAWTAATKLMVPFSLTVCAALLLILPLVFDYSLTEAFRRVVTIIAISSPIGILIAIPLSYFSGIALARSKGIVLRDSKVVEKSSVIKAVVFNKAGTLTEKNYSVTDIKTDKMDPATFLKVAAHAEANSQSNVAKAILSAYGEEISKELVQNFTEYPGKGVSVTVDGIQIILGSAEFMAEKGVPVSGGVYEGNVVYMAVNDIYAGKISLSEAVTRDASDTVHRLSATAGIERIAMVSGDGRERDRIVANELAIDEYYAECLPEEKAQRIRGLKERIDSRSTLAFVGSPDAPNEGFDAADIGIMINGISCRSALPQADVVIIPNSTAPITSIIRIARVTNRFVFWGAMSCCLVKFFIIILASFGIAPIWFGMLIDTCASLGFIISCLNIISRNGFKKAAE
ncbi:MAG: HAD-IC family P-type ATPase [Clostridiales bacterium]|nr:HAD-IC family P-type ATPase [Clostridiales bacterium]